MSHLRSFGEGRRAIVINTQTPTAAELDHLCVSVIRGLAMDAVQAANSGHPGTPVAMAPVVYALWQRILRFDPDDPIWPNRDRFVLSMGHASALLYSLLHLTGVKAVNPAYETPGEPAVSLDDLRRFRQLDSKCPGHPEYRWTSGVETTTGPLGQGLATSVGMAIAARWQAAHFNRPGYALFDHRVFALCGDGCLMEGVSGEAASLAGHWRLGNLCWVYDSNRITIEGSTALAFTEDVATRFLGYGWNVLRVADANDLDRLERAFRTFEGTTDRPTLVIVDSHIAYGVPGKEDSPSAHGEPLGAEATRGAKRFYGLDPEEQFAVPAAAVAHLRDGLGRRGRRLRDDWRERFEAYRKEYPVAASHLTLMQKRQLPDGWDRAFPTFQSGEVNDPKQPGRRTAAAVSGRDASGKVLNALAEHYPWLLGGSADLAPSTKTRLTFAGAGDFQADTPGGRNVHFGVREHAMGAILNGLAAGKVRAFGSGFLIFSDYGRPPIRLAALMELPVVYVFTHDSIGVGEDGPTHQPVEQLAGLRSVPNLLVFRPADANEVVEAWRHVAQLRHQPAVLVLSRQELPVLDRTRYASAAGVRRGGYVLSDPPGGDPQVLLIATGSEVSLALDAQEVLASEGVRARVVSLPCWELFEQQDQGYRQSVLPDEITARVAVEQAACFGWHRYVGRTGAVVGMRTFGASAPLKELAGRFGFTPAAVAEAARDQLHQEG